MNLGTLFSRHAKYRPDHLAVVFEDQRLTWLEFNKSINRLAHVMLKFGIRKGDKVAAKFQRVHAVVIMGDFPRNVAGKTLKRVMRDNYGKNHK